MNRIKLLFLLSQLPEFDILMLQRMVLYYYHNDSLGFEFTDKFKSKGENNAYDNLLGLFSVFTPSDTEYKLLRKKMRAGYTQLTPLSEIDLEKHDVDFNEISIDNVLKKLKELSDNDNIKELGEEMD